jgi:SAM-dependent methyltransferase
MSSHPVDPPDDRRDYWDQVYRTKAVDAVSWFQPHASRSIELIRAAGLPAAAALIDVGSGASRLIDDLIDLGLTNITALDLSASALDATRLRLGQRAASVQWIEADITTVVLPDRAYDLWHDRAAFHFLTDAAQRQAYVAAAERAIRPRGHLIVATFADDGPTRCSGLPVMRYSADALNDTFSARFSRVACIHESHVTPSGAEQRFVYCHWRRIHD